MTATTGPLDRVYTREEAEAMRARSEVMPADAVGETVLTFFTAALGDARRILRGPVDWKGFDALMAFRNASIDHYAQKTKDDWKRLGQPVECARGCTRCCQQHVLASFSECFAAVRALRAAGFTDFASVEAQATLAATMSHEARWAGKVSCAMLDAATNLCRVYKARPGICRAYMSLSKHHCYFETTAPTPEQIQYMTMAIICGTDAALMERGLEMAQVELMAGVAAAAKPGRDFVWITRHAGAFAGAALRTDYAQMLQNLMVETAA